MAVPWYKIVLLAPLLWIVAMLAAPRLWRPMIFVGLVLASQWAVNTLVVTEPVVRYLHLLAWLTLLLVAVLLQSLVRHAAGRLHRSLTGMAAFRARSDLCCPLWVKSRHMRCKNACPLYPQ